MFAITDAFILLALCLPQLDHYFEAPRKTKCISIHQQLGYNFTLQGNHDPNKYTLRQCFLAQWKYLTGVIGKGLGHKTRSFDS